MGRLLDEHEKASLSDQLVSETKGLLAMTTQQPWSSSMFKTERRDEFDEPKDIETRPWGPEAIKRDHKFVAIVSGLPCTKRRQDGSHPRQTCYTKKSQKLAKEKKDETLLVPLKCQSKWNTAMDFVRRNGGRPDTGFPYHTMEGILLFEGELTQAEQRRHPWFVPGYGSRSMKVKKVIKFAQPITGINGCPQGRPQSLYKCLYVGIHPKKDKNTDLLQRSERLRNLIRDQLRPYLQN